MDEQPAHWHAGRVRTHEQVGRVLRGAGDNGWIGARDDFDRGGLQMPEMLYSAIHGIFEAANSSAQGSPGADRWLGTAHHDVWFTRTDRNLCDAYVHRAVAGDHGPDRAAGR